MTPIGTVTIENASGHALIRFTGFLDASMVQQARQILQEKIPATCPCFIVDLSTVDFLDSHGVGLFVTLLKRAHANRGKLIITGAEGQPASVLQIVGLNGPLVLYRKNAQEAKQEVSMIAGEPEN